MPCPKSETDSPRNAKWRNTGKYGGHVGKSPSPSPPPEPCQRSYPLTPSPTQPAAQPARKRGLKNLFVDDDDLEPFDIWGDQSRKKQRVGAGNRVNDLAADDGEDSDDNGTIFGEGDDDVLSRSSAVSYSAGGNCEAEWPDICDRRECPKCGGKAIIDLSSEDDEETGHTAQSGPAYKSGKSAKNPIKNVNTSDGPQGGKGTQNSKSAADAALQSRKLKKELIERTTKQFKSHYARLKAATGEIRGRLVKGYVGPAFTPAELDDKMADIEVHAEGMNMRHEESKGPKKAKTKLAKVDLPRDNRQIRQMVTRGAGELQRQWMSTVAVTRLQRGIGAKSMYRCTDSASRGRLRDPDKGMEAAGGANLNTVEHRRHWIKCHLNWGYRGPGTPFTSWSHDLYYLHTTAQRIPHITQRAAAKQPADAVWLTQMNINARINSGRPILNALDEYNYYLPNEKSDGSMYKKEWLLLYQVHPEEIVWNWNWRHVQQWMFEHDCFETNNWEDAIANPAYEIHEKARRAGKTAKERRRAVNQYLQGTNMSYAALIEEDLA